MQDPKKRVRALISSSVGETDDTRLLALLGEAIDVAGDDADIEGVRLAISAAETATLRDLQPASVATLRYFIGCGWSILRHVAMRAGEDIWNWESEEQEQELLNLRRALSSPGFSDLAAMRRCQTLTNLGNVLSNVGRFVEALECYARALEIEPAFGMALGNQGQCLMGYAKTLYDPGHRCVFSARAAVVLQKSLRAPLENPAAGAAFSALLDTAKRQHDGHCAEPGHLDSFSLGSSEEERAFRRWSLLERLFLNPLNDLGAFSIAARDVLHLPKMVVNTEIGTAFHGFYNQLKQEYAAARWLLFDGGQESSGHFSDRDLNLLDTLDGTEFGFRLEKTKLALRSAYSILDKIAVFVRYYFDLPNDLRRCGFRTVWFKNSRSQNGLHDALIGRQNWPLRGLFWTSKDLDERGNKDLHAALEPDAQRIALIRNQLEHGYLKTREPLSTSTPAPPPDSIALAVAPTELAAKALRVVKVTRAALIYLPLAVHQEERERPAPDANKTPAGMLYPVTER